MTENQTPISKIVKSLGLVFGDIGTSPIYTVGAILLFLLPTTFNMFGLLSLITWTLFTIITIQYIWLAMSLSDKGEGGTIVLKTILDSLLKPGITASAVSILTIIGIALFIGDGVITPAISILSAVEGILLIPGFEETSQNGTSPHCRSHRHRAVPLPEAGDRPRGMGIRAGHGDLVWCPCGIRCDLDHRRPAGALCTKPDIMPWHLFSKTAGPRSSSCLP